jgi:transketolase
MGTTLNVMDLGSIQAKFESFGFIAQVVDGHSEADIDMTVRKLWENPSDRPRVLVAKTVKGKGVPFMEHNNAWHYTRLTTESHALALAAITGEVLT